MAERIRIPLSPAVARTAGEAEAMGIASSTLIEADLARLRALAAAATPRMSEDEADVVAEALSSIESSRLISGDDSIPSPAWLSATLTEMADEAGDGEVMLLDRLAQEAAGWSPLAVLGLMMRMRGK